MDNWDTNTYRFRVDPETPEPQAQDNTPAENGSATSNGVTAMSGPATADRPTATGWQPDNAVPTPQHPVEGIGMAETPITSTDTQETGFVLVDTPAPSEDYEPITEADIFSEEESEEYNTFTDPYGMPMRPDGTSYYSAPTEEYTTGSSTNTYSNRGNHGASASSYTDAGYGHQTGHSYNSTDYGQAGRSYNGTGYGQASRSYNGTGYGQTGHSYNSTDYGQAGRGSSDYQTSHYQGSTSSRSKASPAPVQLTRRAFIAILLVAMLLTSGLTVGGIAIVGNSFAPKDTSATNYTLTESKETLDIASVVHKSKDGIVSITTEGMSTDMWAQNYITKGAGSGVIVQSDGYIVTCYHVIEDASKIQVTTADSKSYEAEVVGTDPDNDLAVIKINAKNLHAISYADSSKLEVGDRVVAIGNPLGTLSNTATTGIISALNRNLNIEGQKLNLLQTDASINPGNSGGALLDASGNLVGIVESKSAGSDVEGLGFAVPVNTVAKSVKEIIETGSVNKGDEGTSDSNNTNKAAIGIVISELSDEMAMMYGYPQGGILITSVTSDNARKAGLQQGDMITSIDGTDVESMQDLHTILSEHKVGDKVKLQVLRDGEIITLTTKLVQATN